MANKQLMDYIREQINAGYNVTSLRDYLIKYGYSQKDVDDAISSLYHPEVKHVVHHLSKPVVMLISAVSIIILLIIPTIYFLISSASGPSRLLDLRTSIITSSVHPGDKLEFNIELSNLGQSKRYDVQLKHEILGTDIYKEETIAVETSTSKKSYIEIPSDTIPKKYTLQTTASYDNKKALSTTGFTIISSAAQTKPLTASKTCIENWECTDWTPSTCPSSGKQTRSCVDYNNCGTSVQKPEISKTCTYTSQASAPAPLETSGLTIWQKLDQIKETAKTNPSKAQNDCAALDVETQRDECYNNVAQITSSSSLCEQIIGSRTKDKCYSDLAQALKTSSLCEQISTSSRKDSCYMNFVNEKDYSVCENLQNSYLKEACTALRDMPSIVVS